MQLDGHWSECVLEQSRFNTAWPMRLWIESASEGIHGGMSGSPIVNQAGEAVGVIGIGTRGLEATICTEGGPHACLQENLPGWVLRQIRPTAPGK